MGISIMQAKENLQKKGTSGSTSPNNELQETLHHKKSRTVEFTEEVPA